MRIVTMTICIVIAFLSTVTCGEAWTHGVAATSSIPAGVTFQALDGESCTSATDPTSCTHNFYARNGITQLSSNSHFSTVNFNWDSTSYYPISTYAGLVSTSISTFNTIFNVANGGYGWSSLTTDNASAATLEANNVNTWGSVYNPISNPTWFSWSITGLDWGESGAPDTNFGNFVNTWFPAWNTSGASWTQYAITKILQAANTNTGSINGIWLGNYVRPNAFGAGYQLSNFSYDMYTMSVQYQPGQQVSVYNFATGGGASGRSATFVGSISGNQLTVASISAGTLSGTWGQTLYDAALDIPSVVKIVSGPGGVGTYTLNKTLGTIPAGGGTETMNAAMLVTPQQMAVAQNYSGYIDLFRSLSNGTNTQGAGIAGDRPYKYLDCVGHTSFADCTPATGVPGVTPFTVFVESTNYQESAPSQPPRVAEFNWASWSVILHGARELNWFTTDVVQQPTPTGGGNFVTAEKIFASNVQALAPVLNSPFALDYGSASNSAGHGYTFPTWSFDYSTSINGYMTDGIETMVKYYVGASRATTVTDDGTNYISKTVSPGFYMFADTSYSEWNDPEGTVPATSANTAGLAATFTYKEDSRGDGSRTVPVFYATWSLSNPTATCAAGTCMFSVTFPTAMDVAVFGPM